ncbi:MAG: 2-phosphosulfolactate phosphatase [Verrucomicrobiota bacterium]
MKIEVLFSPAEFAALQQRDLSESTCVVFDILRATTSMMTALAHGAERIFPVAEIAEAIALRQTDSEILLAGEREGLRILAAQTGSVDFDLGNSPREFTAVKVRGKSIAMTTTNGTRALQSCAGAKRILIGSFLNLNALAENLRQENPSHLILVCAGTFEETAYEDTLAAGVLVDLLSQEMKVNFSDSAHLARQIFQHMGTSLLEAMQFSRNGRRLLSNPDLRDDVSFCLQRDTLSLVADMREGFVKRIG